MNGARIELPQQRQTRLPIYRKPHTATPGSDSPHTPNPRQSTASPPAVPVRHPGWDPDLPVVRIPGEGVTALLNAVALSRYLTDIGPPAQPAHPEQALLMDAMRATNMPDTDIATTGLSNSASAPSSEPLESPPPGAEDGGGGNCASPQSSVGPASRPHRALRTPHPARATVQRRRLVHCTPHRTPRPARPHHQIRAGGLAPHVTDALRDLGTPSRYRPAIPEHTLRYDPPGATGHEGVEAVALLAAEIGPRLPSPAAPPGCAPTPSLF